MHIIRVGLYSATASLALAVRLAAQDGPIFTSIQALSNREVRLQWNAPSGAYCRVDACGTLSEWRGFVTLAGSSLTTQVDSGAPFVARRFYRAARIPSAGAVTGDHLATTNGDVIIHPVTHASLALCWGSKTIYVDPAANSFAGLPRADLILFTHNHSDHFSASAVVGLTNAGAAIVAPQEVYSALSTGLKSITTVLTNGMSTNKIGLTIDAMPAYNFANTPHEKGPKNGYVLSVGGSRIYISGDTEDTPEMRALRDIDVAFLAMNSPYTMTVSQAVSAVRAFCPAVVYPDHYRNSNGTFADVNAFKQQVMENPGVEVRLRAWY